MLLSTCNSIIYYGGALMVLCTVYFQLTGQLSLLSQRLINKMIQLTNSMFFEEETIESVSQINFPVLCVEIIMLHLTIYLLKTVKKLRGKDRMDKLLNESKKALRQTNDFLEKWRVNMAPNKHSYLDEEPQQIKPLKLEMPLLHMAIIDTLGTTRSKPERGDAGDTVNITDSTLLSVSSLFADDFDSETDIPMDDDKLTEELKHIELKYRHLWDVIEED